MEGLSYDVPLAPRSSMGVGGPARYFIEARDEATLRGALSWAEREKLPVLVLGGGSNVLVADSGVDALVIALGLRGVQTTIDSEEVELTAAAGEPWDPLVAETVARGWAGFECLSGIPGLVGATPIQNVGAYGQEVSETIVHVRAYDRRARQTQILSAEDCEFGYRNSRFKSLEPGRFVILSVTYRLKKDGVPTVRYRELVDHLEATNRTSSPTPATVRDAVLAIRRRKSMLLDPEDENSRSCGSFFVNPVVSAEHADRIAESAGERSMPRYPASDGRVKLSAAWLIEQTGFRRGFREGPVGLSTRHALALVCHHGATASDVAALAARIQGCVKDRFSVDLLPEPNFWGFSHDAYFHSPAR